MYKEISINDFRLFHNQTLLLGKYLTVLSGRNSTGKSTILGMLANSGEQKKKDGVIADEEQAELEDLAVYLVAVGKLVKRPTTTEKPEQAKPHAYVPPKGEENIAVLSLTKGRRFNPDTGKREAPVFTQKFNANEYRLFMEHYKSLGYTIEEVIYNPFEK